MPSSSIADGQKWTCISIQSGQLALLRNASQSKTIARMSEVPAIIGYFDGIVAVSVGDQLQKISRTKQKSNAISEKRHPQMQWASQSWWKRAK